MVFLGGLISEELGKSRAGIPILRSLPVLGFVFGEKRMRSIERELVIVIVPNIVNRVREPQTLDQAISEEYDDVLMEFGEEEPPEQE